MEATRPRLGDRMSKSFSMRNNGSRPEAPGEDGRDATGPEEAPASAFEQVLAEAVSDSRAPDPAITNEQLRAFARALVAEAREAITQAKAVLARAEAAATNAREIRARHQAQLPRRTDNG